MSWWVPRSTTGPFYDSSQRSFLDSPKQENGRRQIIWLLACLPAHSPVSAIANQNLMQKELGFSFHPPSHPFSPGRIWRRAKEATFCSQMQPSQDPAWIKMARNHVPLRCSVYIPVLACGLHQTSTTTTVGVPFGFPFDTNQRGSTALRNIMALPQQTGSLLSALA